MAEIKDPVAHACELVGRFFYHFSRMELQLDTAIAKLFKLDPLYAPIITANMPFISKVNALQSAVSQGKFSVDAEATIKDIIAINNPPRVTIAHSVFEPEQNGVTFTRITAKKELKVELPHWTDAEFQAFFQTLERLESALKKIIPELQPDKITWPSAAYLSQAFFSPSTPLALRLAAEVAASREKSDEKPK